MSAPTPHSDLTDAGASMWQSPADDQTLLDEDCSPTKTCRNMVGITFDGFAEAGGDLHEAWQATLEREGKLSGTSVRDIVLGPHNS